MSKLTREQLELVMDELRMVSYTPGQLQQCARTVLDHDAALRTELAQAQEKVNELEADRSVQHNGARMLARYVLATLPEQHTTHDEGELYNCANGFLESKVPNTTPWLIQMMEVARRDINELPQQLFQAIEQRGQLQADLARVTVELDKYRNFNCPENLKGVREQAEQNPSSLAAQHLYAKSLEQQLAACREALEAIYMAWNHKPHDDSMSGFHAWFSAHIEKIEVLSEKKDAQDAGEKS